MKERRRAAGANFGLLECVRERDGSVMESADMQVLEACARKGVRVQVPPEPLAHSQFRRAHSGQYHASTSITAVSTRNISGRTHHGGGPVTPYGEGPAAGSGRSSAGMRLYIPSATTTSPTMPMAT